MVVQRKDGHHHRSPATVVSPVRVGGGYQLPAKVDSVEKVSLDTLSTLVTCIPQDGAYSEEDFQILSEIIQGAETSSRGRKITLTRLLNSYDHTLLVHGIDSEKDTRLYRFILKLSLDPNPDWWSKFEDECRLHANVDDIYWVPARRVEVDGERERTGDSLAPPAADASGSVSQSKVSSIVGRWRANASKKKKARTQREALEMWEQAVAFERKRKLRRVLQAWYIYDMVLLSKAMNVWRCNALRYHFNAWALHVHKHEILCITALAKRNEKELRRTFSEWLRVTRKSQLDKISALKAITYWSYNNINKCMSLWLLTVKQKKRDLLHSDGVYHASLQIRSINAWKAETELGKKLRAARAIRMRHLESRLFEVWRSEYSKAIDRKIASSKNLERMRKQTLGSILLAWAKELEYKKMMRQALFDCLLKVKGVRRRHAFRA